MCCENLVGNIKDCDVRMRHRSTKVGSRLVEENEASGWSCIAAAGVFLVHIAKAHSLNCRHQSQRYGEGELFSRPRAHRLAHPGQDGASGSEAGRGARVQGYVFAPGELPHSEGKDEARLTPGFRGACSVGRKW